MEETVPIGTLKSLPKLIFDPGLSRFKYSCFFTVGKDALKALRQRTFEKNATDVFPNSDRVRDL